MAAAGKLEVELGVEVAAKDGVILRTDVQRPAGEGAFPVVLMRTPYGTRNAPTLQFGRALARLGLAVVVQNVRGRYGSGGRFEPFRREAEDGLATLEWLARQAWSDGRVVLFGVSYSSFAACALAGFEPPPGARPMGLVSLVSMARPWRHVYRGGALVLHWAFPWSLIIDGPRQPDLRPLDLPRLIRAPVEELARRAGCSPRPWLDWVARREPDDPLWSAVDTLPALRARPLPTLHIGGWYDFSVASTLELYRALAAAAPPGTQRLILGPWEHNEVFDLLLGGLRGRTGGVAGAPPGERLADELLARLGEWLEMPALTARVVARDALVAASACTARRTEPADAPARVWRATATGGEWLELVAWPPPSTTHRLFLHAPTRPGGVGKLREKPADVSSSITWHHDPDNPVPSRGGRQWAVRGWIEAGPLEQDVAPRADVVAYVGEPLAAPLDVAGPVRVRLWVRPGAGRGAEHEPVELVEPVEYCAKLIDITSDGRAVWVADGIARRRPGCAAPPGDAVVGELSVIGELVVDVGEICYRFGRQHRLRIELAASSFPQYERSCLPGERRVDHGRQEPSRLELSVVRGVASEDGDH